MFLSKGLKVGDEVIEFGSVNTENFQNLQNIASVVQHSEGVSSVLCSRFILEDIGYGCTFSLNNVSNSESADGFFFTETITCHCDQGWPESSDELDSTAVVRQRLAGVSPRGTHNLSQY